MLMTVFSALGLPFFWGRHYLQRDGVTRSYGFSNYVLCILNLFLQKKTFILSLSLVAVSTLICTRSTALKNTKGTCKFTAH
jgi:hypothetical protein